MTYSAAVSLTAENAAFHQLLARYGQWLDQAYRATASDQVRTLICEVADELRVLARHGAAAFAELADLVRGALQSVLAAIEAERVAPV